MLPHTLTLLALLVIASLFLFLCCRRKPAGAGFLPHRIGDSFTTLAALKAALRAASLESCNLIVAIDFTKSNEWTGARSFGGRCLHTITPGAPNMYERALASIAAQLAEYDEDGLIPAYGFGDLSTRATAVFSFMPDDAPCAGLGEVLRRYRALAPRVALNGGTSFAPAIRKACALMAAAAQPPQYHILLLLCDGQVSDECKADTVDAIVAASSFPLSIVCVGVGDGPWGLMESLDDWDGGLAARRWDNFQFVPYEATLARARRGAGAGAEDEAFALAALMEVPEGLAEIRRLGLLSARSPAVAPVRTLEPPDGGGGENR